MGHDRVRDPGPAGAVLALRVGAGLEPDGEPDAVDEPEHRQRVDAVAEDAEQGRQEGQGVEQRREHRQHPADPERAERGRREHEQPAEAGGDREAGEGDGLAGGGDRDLDRLADRPALAQLLSEPADHEQRVVDRERQAQHGRDVLDVDAHLDLLADDVHERERGRDREAGDEERDPGGDERGEHEDEHEGGDRERDGLRLDEVPLGLLGRVAGQGRVPAEEVVDAVARVGDLRLEAVDERHGRLVRDVEVDDDVGRPPVLRDEPVVTGLGEADRARDGRVAGEARQRAGDRRLEGGPPGVRAVRPAIHDDEGAAPCPELVGQAVRDRRRFGIGVEPAARGQHRRGPTRGRGRRDADDEGEDEDDPAVPVDEGSPAAEHRALRDSGDGDARGGRPVAVGRPQ